MITEPHMFTEATKLKRSFMSIQCIWFSKADVDNNIINIFTSSNNISIASKPDAGTPLTGSLYLRMELTFQ